jgi:hypothetical protein
MNLAPGERSIGPPEEDTPNKQKNEKKDSLFGYIWAVQ